jgi:hypothetical protein
LIVGDSIILYVEVTYQDATSDIRGNTKLVDIVLQQYFCIKHQKDTQKLLVYACIFNTNTEALMMKTFAKEILEKIAA